MTFRIHGCGIAGLITWFLSLQRGFNPAFSERSFFEIEKSTSCISAAVVDISYYQNYKDLWDILEMEYPRLSNGKFVVPFQEMLSKARPRMKISNAQVDVDIWATGWQIENTPFDWLPLKSARGLRAVFESAMRLPFSIESKKITKIEQENAIILTGLNKWHDLHAPPSQEEIGEFFEASYEQFPELIKLPKPIISHGIRPASYDRVPLVGFHPKLTNQLCINGLGSFGFSRVWEAVSYALECIQVKNNVEHPFRIERCFRKYLPQDLL